MGEMMTVILWLLGITLLYLFLIAPNVLRRKTGWKAWGETAFAHRGLHDEKQGIPENSLVAFRRAVETGMGIEMDIRLTRDGQMVVFHDSSLQRMCGADGQISQMTLAQLKQYRLGDTGETIPTLDEALALIGGRVPLILEIKSAVLGREEIPPLLYDRMREYDGPYCVESFDPLAVRWFRRHAPKIMRGQLACDNRVTQPGKKQSFLNFCCANLLMDFLSRPDFVAYDYRADRNLSFRVMRNVFRPILAAWPVRSQKDYERNERYYDFQIVESFLPPKQRIIDNEKEN